MNWDTLPALWDKGIHWDRPTLPVSLKEINMQLFKLLLNLLRWGEPRFGTKAELIVTSMTTEPMLTLVPDPLPATVATRVFALAALADYKTAAQAADDGGASAIKDRDQKRAIVEGVLTDWAPVVELAAKAANDLTILTQSGYDLRKPIVTPSSNGIPPAPIIALKRGQVSGSVVARAKPLLNSTGSYEGQYAVGDPMVEANFKPGVIAVTGSRVTFTGLAVATLHHIRVRGIGSKGAGDWSDHASIIVT